MKEGILVHLIRSGKANTQKWISNEGELESLSLSWDILEGLRLFWRSRDQLFYSQVESGDLGNGKSLVVTAERLAERRTLIIFGAGHVGFSIAVIGVIIGFRVILFDDREEFLERASAIDRRIECISGDFDRISNSLEISTNSAVVIVTRGHQCDEVILRQIAVYNAGYVGMIGSRRRVQSVFRRLRQQGISDSFLRSVKAPIGLDIGAKTPQEIAVSVHAEIIEHFNSADSQVGCEVAS